MLIDLLDRQLVVVSLNYCVKRVGASRHSRACASTRPALLMANVYEGFIGMIDLT